MLVPDYYFDTVYDIPLSLLKKEHIRCLLLDIDNTLVPYDVSDSTEQNRAVVRCALSCRNPRAFRVQ